MQWLWYGFSQEASGMIPISLCCKTWIAELRVWNTNKWKTYRIVWYTGKKKFETRERKRERNNSGRIYRKRWKKNVCYRFTLRFKLHIFFGYMEQERVHVQQADSMDWMQPAFSYRNRHTFLFEWISFFISFNSRQWRNFSDTLRKYRTFCGSSGFYALVFTCLASVNTHTPHWWSKRVYVCECMWVGGVG